VDYKSNFHSRVVGLDTLLISLKRNGRLADEPSRYSLLRDSKLGSIPFCSSPQLAKILAIPKALKF
jgi:hypothetical protein